MEKSLSTLNIKSRAWKLSNEVINEPYFLIVSYYLISINLRSMFSKLKKFLYLELVKISAFCSNHLAQISFIWEVWLHFCVFILACWLIFRYYFLLRLLLSWCCLLISRDCSCCEIMRCFDDGGGLIFYQEDWMLLSLVITKFKFF